MAFCGYLKQSTAVTIMLGPFVDETDGKTAETGLTISQADVRLSKNAGNMAQKNESTSCTHDEIGIYSCPLDATDTGTLGLLDVMVHESGALPVHQTYQVVVAHWYDTMCGSDYLQVDAVQVEGSDATDQIRDAVVDDETRIDASDLNSIADDLKDGGRLDLLVDAIKARTDNLPDDPADDSDIDTQLAAIKSDTAAILTDTGTDGVALADGAITATKIAADAIGASELAADAVAEIADAVWDELSAGHTDAGKAGAQLWTDVDAILADTAEIGAAGAGLTAIPWNAAWDAEVESEAADALSAYDPPTHAELVSEINDVQTDIAGLNDPTVAQIADAVWDEAQADHVGAGTFGEVATETAAILADTAEIGAAGAGLTAIPWNAAWDAEVESEVDDALGAGGADLTAIPWNAAWDAEVESECTDALNAYDPPTKAELDTAVADVSVDEIQASALADLFNTDSGTDYASAVAGSVVKETADNAGGSALTEAGIADAVWDEAQADHVGAGTFGEIATEMALTLADTNELQTDLTDGGRLDLLIDAIKAKTDNLPDDPADDSDIDAQLATIAGYLDTEIAAILADTNELQTDLTDGGRLDLLIDAIKAKTDNLPDDPADDSDIDAQLAAIKAETAAILADTGTDGVALADGAITSSKLAQSAAQEIADALLARGVSNVEDIADPTSLAALILAAFESVVSGTTWTIYKTDHATTFATKTVTTDPTAEPITEVT